MRTGVIIVGVSLILAGCGEGSNFDTSFKKSYREKGIKSCVEQARARSPMGAARVDVEGLCSCTIDKVMEGKSATELMGAPDERKASEAISQCARRFGIPERNAPAGGDPNPG